MKNVILFCLFFVLAFSKDITDNIIESSSYGDKTINEQQLQGYLNQKDKNTYYNETILNWHYFFEKHNARAAEITGAKKQMIIPVAVHENNISDTNETQNNFVIVKGFCFITDDVNVGKQPSSLRVKCQTNVGAITMFAVLVNLNEKASLVVDPKYIEKKGVRFEVKSAIVTNEEKTSYNVATYVNDRKLAKVGWSALEVSTDEIKNATNEYLVALRESQKKEEIHHEVVESGSNTINIPIKTENTEKPDWEDYALGAGINIVASTIKTTAAIFKSDLPYLYQIVGKTKIWIDLKVNRKGEYAR